MIRNLIKFIALSVPLLLVFVVAVWLRPQRDPVPILPPLAPLTSPEPTEEAGRRGKLARVELVAAGEVSAAARAELETGRFIVETSLPAGIARAKVYRSLILRDGIFVVRDRAGLNTRFVGGTRQPLTAETLEGRVYALDRPRRLHQSDYPWVEGYAPAPGEIVYLLMPAAFEGQVLTLIEKQLNQPLSSYRGARVHLDVSRNGHLQLELRAVQPIGQDWRDVKPQPVAL